MHFKIIKTDFLKKYSAKCVETGPEPDIEAGYLDSAGYPVGSYLCSLTSSSWHISQQLITEVTNCKQI